MTPDEILKATTPNAVKEAGNERLDHLYNVASGMLLTTDEGLARQLQNSIQAIHAERSRRLAKKPKWIEWAILIVTVIGVLVAIYYGALSRGTREPQNDHQEKGLTMPSSESSETLDR